MPINIGQSNQMVSVCQKKNEPKSKFHQEKLVLLLVFAFLSLGFVETLMLIQPFFVVSSFDSPTIQMSSCASIFSHLSISFPNGHSASKATLTIERTHSLGNVEFCVAKQQCSELFLNNIWSKFKQDKFNKTNGSEFQTIFGE